MFLLECNCITRQNTQTTELLLTGFLSWFRNGLLATGIGVISFVQSDLGREAAYGRNPAGCEQHVLSLNSEVEP